MNDIEERRKKHGTDERGRHLVNGHGDVDVVRTPKSGYPVQLPVEEGAEVTIDGKTEVFTNFHQDALVWDTGATEGVHHFNTRVRNATEVNVEYPNA